MWNIKKTVFGALDCTLIVDFVHRIKSFENSLSWIQCVLCVVKLWVRAFVPKCLSCYHHQLWAERVSGCACKSASVSLWMCERECVCVCKMCFVDFNSHSHLPKKEAPHPYPAHDKFKWTVKFCLVSMLPDEWKGNVC